MNAGILNRQVRLQRRLDTQNVLGEKVSGWTDVATVWASVRQKSGLETIRSEMEMSIVTASIRIRYRTDVNAMMRVLDGTDVYDVQAVIYDKVKKEYIDLVCQIGASDG